MNKRNKVIIIIAGVLVVFACVTVVFASLDSAKAIAVKKESDQVTQVSVKYNECRAYQVLLTDDEQKIVYGDEEKQLWDIDNTLGKYVVMLVLCDTTYLNKNDTNELLARQYPHAYKAYDLEGGDMRIMWSSSIADHATRIFIGCDKPLSVKQTEIIMLNEAESDGKVTLRIVQPREGA